MTACEKLQDLARVVGAQYEQRQRAFAALLARENELRGELRRLDQMRHGTDVPQASVDQMQAIGADVIWQGWVARAKTALNLQLAQVLAQKEYHQQAVRQAYGKVLVVEQMVETAHRDRNERRAKAQSQNAIAQSLLK